MEIPSQPIATRHRCKLLAEVLQNQSPIDNKQGVLFFRNNAGTDMANATNYITKHRGHNKTPFYIIHLTFCTSLHRSIDRF